MIRLKLYTLPNRNELCQTSVCQCTKTLLPVNSQLLNIVRSQELGTPSVTGLQHGATELLASSWQASEC